MWALLVEDSVHGGWVAVLFDSWDQAVEWRDEHDDSIVMRGIVEVVGEAEAATVGVGA